ncbi:MAG TPA: dUTP diphosphatase [Candidatus Binataceae bacterium]|nr:dUTP diphosphatase [Candidatus Binataceae bacterium]
MSTVIKFKRLTATAKIPAYQTARAAGMDLVADVTGTIFVPPGERRAIPTGLTIEIPPGYEGQVRPRSGRAINEGLTMINSPGTIDADYRGEVKVLIVNLGDRTIEIKPGDRIAQLIIAPVVRAEIEEAAELADSKRGSGGFGHTGR